MHENDKRDILNAIAEGTRATIEGNGRVLEAILLAAQGDHAQHQKTRALIREFIAAVNQRFDSIEEQENKIMASLDTEFAALNTAFTDLSTAIDKEIQQVLDSIAAGNDAKATVEDARTRITALTSAMSDKVAALASDDTPST